jgi:predicted SAM-dependent methyltransferase
MHRQAFDSLPHFGVSARAQTLADKLAHQRLAQASLRSPYRALRRWAGRRRLKQLHRESSRRIVFGAAGVYPHGWIPTDADFLDLLRPQDWSRCLQEGSLDAILAEHVWEHLHPEHAVAAARQCYRYLRPGGYLRAAVPDGLHPDPTYIETVAPGGSGAGAEDHRVLYTYATFASIFEKSGFTVNLLEHFDEEGRFHSVDWDPAEGMIHRSRRFDEPNGEGRELAYTSIILDASKAS